MSLNDPRDLPRRDALDDAPPGCPDHIGLFANPDPSVFAARLPIFTVATPLICLLLPVLFGSTYGPALALLFAPTAFVCFLGPHLPHEHRLTATLLAYAAAITFLWAAT